MRKFIIGTRLFRTFFDPFHDPFVGSENGLSRSTVFVLKGNDDNFPSWDANDACEI